jgi:hypothetical protein
MLTIADYLLAVFIYVAFRSRTPDLATAWEVLKELRDYNIDENQLLNWSPNRCAMLNCQQKEKVTDREMEQEMDRKFQRL